MGAITNRKLNRLDNYRVLDLTNEKGYMCGKTLGDLGADVIKIEPPGGDPGRQTPPWYKAGKTPENGLYYMAYNTSKRGITLDITGAAGRKQFLELVLTSDVVIESFTPGYLERLNLSYADLKRANPGVILVSISGFGQTGPYAQFKAPDLVLQAMGGLMNLVGDLDRAPLRTTAPQSYLHACNEAAAGALIAIWHREKTGNGQWVDVSAQECILWLGFSNYSYWDFKGINAVRGNVDHTGLTVDEAKNADFFRCKDGYVIFTPNTGRNGNRTRKFIEWMQEEGAASEFLTTLDWEASIEDRAGKPLAEMTPEERTEFRKQGRARGKQIKDECSVFILTKTKKELWQQAYTREFMLAPINNIKEVLEDEAFAVRKLWQTVTVPEMKKPLVYPGAPYKTDVTPYLISRPAPAVGEHNDEVFAELTKAPKSVFKKPQPDATAPFRGLKILDFTWVTVGPRAMRYFGDHGATIIKVEAPERHDVGRMLPPLKEDLSGPDRSNWFALYNLNKYDMTIELTNPAGMEIARKLVKWADVMTESFRPGVMEKYRLDYESVKKINPGIIYASTTMFGQNGPYSAFGGYGYHAAAMCGFDDLTGWPDRVPIGAFWAYTDHVAPQFLVDAITMALMHREKTGEGQYIDQSQNESAVHFLTPQILDYELNGNLTTRNGNRDEAAAPHGVFRCRGNDRWCAIAVFTEEEWRVFCRITSQPALANDPRFATLKARKENEDELEKIIEVWTLQHRAEDVMILCQHAGIASGVVQTSEDLHADPQIKTRQHYWNIDHPVIGPHPVDAIPFRLSQSPAQLYRRQPMLAEHNQMVCSEILGLSDEEFITALISGAFGAV